jgi:hypothetical protein
MLEEVGFDVVSVMVVVGVGYCRSVVQRSQDFQLHGFTKGLPRGWIATSEVSRLTTNTHTHVLSVVR